MVCSHRQKEYNLTTYRVTITTLWPESSALSRRHSLDSYSLGSHFFHQDQTLGYQPLYLKNNCVTHRDSCLPILCATEVLSCLQDTRNWRQAEDAEVNIILEQWSSTFRKLPSFNTLPLVVEPTINYFCWYFITGILLLLWTGTWISNMHGINRWPLWGHDP